MNRRGFFGTLLGAALCRWLPAIRPAPFDSRIDVMDISTWGIVYHQAADDFEGLLRSGLPVAVSSRRFRIPLRLESSR